jgi:hypothetical protein
LLRYSSNRSCRWILILQLYFAKFLENGQRPGPKGPLNSAFIPGAEAPGSLRNFLSTTVVLGSEKERFSAQNQGKRSFFAPKTGLFEGYCLLISTHGVLLILLIPNGLSGMMLLGNQVFFGGGGYFTVVRTGRMSDILNREQISGVLFMGLSISIVRLGRVIIRKRSNSSLATLEPR